MLADFKAFIAKGNVLDLAVAVIVGAAFAKIVSSLTDDIIMPIVGKIFGGLDFSSHFTLKCGASSNSQCPAPSRTTINRTSGRRTSRSRTATSTKRSSRKLCAS